MADGKDPIAIETAAITTKDTLSGENPQLRGSPDVTNNGVYVENDEEAIADIIDSSKKGFFAYFLTKEFYIIIVLGYVLFRHIKVHYHNLYLGGRLK